MPRKRRPLPESVKITLDPLGFLTARFGQAADRAAAKAVRERPQLDAHQRLQQPSPPKRVPYTQRPGALGSPIAGPPVPITPAGTTPRVISGYELGQAERRAEATARAIRPAEKNFIRSRTAYDAFLKAHPEKKLDPGPYAAYKKLHRRYLADLQMLRRQGNRYDRSLERYGTLTQRAQEYQLAQGTSGIYQPTRDQYQQIAREALRHGTASFTDVGRAVAGVAPHLYGTALGAFAPGVGRAVGEYVPAVKPYDIPGRLRGTAAGLAATTGALVESTLPTGQRAIYGLRGTPTAEPKQVQSGLIPTEVAVPVAKGVGKALVGGVGASVLAVTEPGTFAKRFGSQAIEAMRGLAQPIGLAVVMSDPNYSLEFKKDLITEQALKPILADLRGRYGDDVTIEEAFERGQEEPFIAGMNAALVLSAASRLLTFGYGVSKGMTVGEALRAVRVPESERTLTAKVRPTKVYAEGRTRLGRRIPVRTAEGDVYRTPGGAPETVPIRWARSPLTRTIVNRPTDIISRGLERVPGLRRLPIAENKRAWRALQRNNARQQRRLPAQVFSIVEELKWAMGGSDEDYATLLAVMLQKPEGFTRQQWGDAVVQNIRNMLDDPDSFIGPEERLTPAMQGLVNRVRRYESKSEDARTLRRSRASERIRADQLNMAITLDGLAAHRELLLEERRKLQEEGQEPANPLVENLAAQMAISRAMERGEPVDVAEIHRLTAERDRLIEEREAPPRRATDAERAAASAELDALVKKHEAALDELAAALFGPIDKAEVARRNVENARARRQKTGRTRTGKRAGYTGRKSVKRPNLKDERRRLVEQRIAEEAERNPDDPTVKMWQARLAEIERLDRIVNPEPEELFGEPAVAEPAPEPMTPERREQLLRELDRELHANRAQRDVLRRDLGEISVDEAPIVSAARDAYRAQIASHPNFADDPQMIEDAMLWSDTFARAAARPRGGDPAQWYEDVELRNVADQAELPEDALFQVREPFQVFPETKTSARLRSKLSPRYAQKEYMLNPRVRRDGQHVLGPITNQGWVRRVLSVMPTEEERQRWAKWYEAVQPLFDRVFGKDADRVLRAFAVSQANASPTSGLQAVLKVADKLNRGEEVAGNEISTVVKSIEAAIRGEPVERGVAAKLSDFIDSLIGARTRTWMGHAAAGGQPAAIDIHALRDLGYVDRRLVGRLEKMGLIEGEHFVVDSPGVATGPRYERAAERYGEITDYLNKTKFDGRDDWTPAETQALGWAAIQKFHGVDPEDLAYAVERSTQTVTAPDASARDLRHFVKAEGGYVQSSGPGWAKAVMTEAQADRVITKLADEYGEARAMWLSNKSKAKRPLLRLEGRVNRALGAELEAAGFTTHWRAGGEHVFYAEGKVDQKRLAATLERHNPEVVFNGKVQENVRARDVDADLGGPGDADRRGGVGRGRGREPDPSAVGDSADTVTPERPRPLAQTRQGDVLGATEFLESTPRGKRIIYLTPQADIATLMHELVHAATDEMFAFYPQEFGRVEQHIGKPYHEWGRDEHEQFATWWERYLSSGHAPSPELVDAFERMKEWMRAIYEGMRRLLGGRVPVETRVLFDTWLGAYDDENVFRIAMHIGRSDDEGFGFLDDTGTYWGTARDVSQRELAALKRRQETRKAKQSVTGMKVRLADLQKQLEELDDVQGPWTEKQHNDYLDLSAKVLNTQAELAIRTDKREQDLRGKLQSLEKALSRGMDNRRFQGALEAMQQLSQLREDVLRQAFGDDFDAVFGARFEDRRDLLAGWLVARGLLEPSFKRGSAHYYPMTMREPSLLPPQAPAAALVSRVVGKTKTDQLNLYKRNQMILWQRGDWTADPAVLVEAVLKAQGYAWMNEVKKQLWNLGRPLTREEAANLPKDVYLVNYFGTPIDMHLRRQLQGGSSTHDAQRVHDALSGTDNAKLESSLTSYWGNFALDGEHLPPGFNAAEGQFARDASGQMISSQYRIVPKAQVHALLRPLRAGYSAGGKALDVGTTMARFATIYANAPGYMLTNATGNLALLLMQQGPWMLPKMMFNAGRLLNDRKMFHAITGETGDLPAFAAISRGRGFDQGIGAGAQALEKGYLSKLSVVDRYPRALAWMYEARKLGYRSNDEMMELIAGKTEKTRRDRDVVSDAATEHMINFNRLSPWERQTLTRFLFIYPFVKGSTAWPFWYAKNYPERAALAANVGATMEERRQRMMGPTPHYAEGYVPIETSSDRRRAQIVRAGSMSPTSTAADELQLLRDFIISTSHKEVDEKSLGIIDHISPIIYDLIKIATQKNQYGEPQSIRETFTHDVLNHTVPWLSIIRSLTDPDTTPRAFLHDRGPQDRALRTLARIPTQTVSLYWLNAQAETHGDVTTEERVAAEKEKVEKAWSAVGGKGPMPNTFSTAATMRVVYEDRVKEYARERQDDRETFEPTPIDRKTNKWQMRYQPSSYERATIMYETVRHYLPAYPLPSPDRILNDPSVRAKPTSALGKKMMERYIEVTSKLMSPSTKLGSGAEKLKTAKQIEKEEPARLKRVARG